MVWFEKTAQRLGLSRTHTALRSSLQGGQTALMCAAQAGKLELVQELLERGADIKAIDEVSLAALAAVLAAVWPGQFLW